MTIFRMWFEQVNQTYVDVNAEDRNDAILKAARKWHREDAQPSVLDVRQLNEPKSTEAK